MKVAFRLESDFFNADKQNDYWDNPIFYEWDHECIPRKKDLIDLQGILPDGLLDDVIRELSWDVKYIRWESFKGAIVAVIYLQGA